jgi:hypothetical protein
MMSISSGTYHIKPTGGDYANMNLAGADLAATLTGDLTFILEGNVTDSSVPEFDTNLNGHKFTITCDTPTGGYQSSTRLWQLYGMSGFRLSGSGLFEMSHLSLKFLGGAIGFGFFPVGTYITAQIFDIVASASTGVHTAYFDFVDTAWKIEMWNSVFKEGNASNDYGSVLFYGIPIVGSKLENITVITNQTVGIYGPASSNLTVKNCAVFGATVACYSNMTNVVQSKNAASDSTGSEVALRNLVAEDHLESLIITDEVFAKVKTTSILKDGGASVGIVDNITGIRGNVRPH